MRLSKSGGGPFPGRLYEGNRWCQQGDSSGIGLEGVLGDQHVVFDGLAEGGLRFLASFMQRARVGVWKVSKCVEVEVGSFSIFKQLGGEEGRRVAN
jgi:hypothetical protein